MRCIRCMREIDEGTSVCGFCNYLQDAPQEDPDALRPGTELRNRFQVGKELGRGGFGITYIGYDKYLDCKVAIKEYYPQSLAARLPGEVKIFWRNSQLRDTGCRNVIREAQKMHKLGDLPVAVRVQDVFYENNTAYIAMDYVEGITLKEYLLKNGVLTPEACLTLMLPVLDTMIQMHREGIIHRDISPDNIMIQPDMQPRILDLGAAKDIQMESGNTILVARNGFSPKEQYQTNGNIGTWTDVYALCATMYYSLTGKVPPPAMDRRDNENDLVFHGPHPLPTKLCDVIRDGMRMLVEQRIPDVAELKRRLESSLVPDAPVPEPPIHDTSGMEVPNPKVPVSKVAVSEPADLSGRIPPSSRISVQAEEKPRGLLPALLALLGLKRQSPDHVDTAPRNQERCPTTVAISQPDAFPCYADPNATICLASEDEEETVLVDEEQPVPANGYLIQDSTGKRIDITKCCFVLGRLTNGGSAGMMSADCMIEDASKHISRKHAVILFNGESFYLQDISVKNSTLLNDIRIQNSSLPENGSVFTAAYPLFDGDRIQLVDEKLTFHAGGSL